MTESAPFAHDAPAADASREAPPEGGVQPATTPAHAAARTPDEPDSAESDALADLFLGPMDQGGPAPALRLAGGAEPNESGVREPVHPMAPSPEAPGRVEGLMLGHLPVLASAWVRQYACHRADQLGGPVALVRLDAGALSIDLIGRGADPSLRGAPSVEAAVRAIAPRARAWLVRVDEPSEPELFALGSVEDLTLLSGADDAAMVASYRAIKSLAARVTWDDEEDGPALRVAWMGCDATRAAHAQAKLSGAVEAFMQRELEHAGVVGRIEPSSSVAVFKGPSDLDAEELLDLVRLVLDDADADELAHLVDARPEPDPDPSPSACPRGRDGRRASAAHVDGPRAETVPDTESCATLLGGLTPVGARAPDAPHVELAHDDAGELHLLGRCERRGESTSRIMQELTSAAAWAVRNAALLRLAVPGLGELSMQRPPTLHLLTETPRDARALLDAPVRVHAVVRVEAGDRTLTTSTPLN